eukprot:1159079-Pelagomonas_calceolata.AAC.2
MFSTGHPFQGCLTRLATQAFDNGTPPQQCHQWSHPAFEHSRRQGMCGHFRGGRYSMLAH